MTYTSGTTGRPKGVVVSHASLTNLLLSMQEILAFGPSERLLAVTTLTFDIAVLELLLPLVSGAAVVIASREEARDPKQLAAAISRRGVTALQATPTLWQALLGAGEAEALRGLLAVDRGRGLAGAAGGAPVSSRARLVQPLRTDRDDDLVDGPADHRSGPCPAAGRTPCRQHPAPHPRSLRRRAAGRRDRRTGDRRGWRRDRLSRPAAAHRRTVSCGYLLRRRRWRPALPHRRSRRARCSRALSPCSVGATTR